MDRQAAINEAAGRLYECGSASDSAALAPISTALGASYTLLFAENPRQGEIHAPAIAGLGVDYLTRLSEAASERIMPQWLRALDVGTVLDRAALQRDNEFTNSPFFDHVVRPAGRFHCLVATPHITSSHRYHLIVGRPMGKDDFDGTDLRVLQSLLPHVGRVIAMEEQLQQTVRLSHSLKCVVDQLATDIIVVSGNGIVEYANAGGERVLAGRDGLARSFTGLAAATSDTTAALRQTIRAVAIGEAEPGRSLTLKRPYGLSPFTVTFAPLVGAGGGATQPANLDQLQVMIIIQKDEPERGHDGRAFGQRYGLTPKERDVVLSLSQGNDLRGVASTLAIGYNTARSHLRRAFEKTGTHRQGDLIRLLLQSDPGLRRCR